MAINKFTYVFVGINGRSTKIYPIILHSVARSETGPHGSIVASFALSLVFRLPVVEVRHG